MIVLDPKTPSCEKKRQAAFSGSLSFKKLHDQRRTFLIWKRIVDIIGSVLIILFILSWLLPVIAILIRLTSKGPVFFIQKRVGFLGRTFKCIKFRTMVVNAEANSKQAVANDVRITKLGRFLRLSNLDELPQFFNVLKGDMSIVGPRPHMHKDCKDFSKVVSNYKFRSIVKPGITGLAQVKGCRGPAKDQESIFRRYQWDSFYVRNQDYKLDTRIIGLTILCTFKSIYTALFSHKVSSKLPLPTNENTGEVILTYRQKPEIKSHPIEEYSNI
jgi:putative colanic acid biosysnthesis UDP-glucose lipid carrier transferase